MKRLLSLLLVICCHVEASTVNYIDSISGNDNNAGTLLSPWQHCPGDTNILYGSVASNSVPSGGHVSGGVTWVFKGGQSYTNVINTFWSGDPSTPIIYDGNTAGTFGTGAAVIDEQYTNVYGFFVKTNQNLIFQGFTVEHAGGIPISQYANFSPPTTYMPPIKGYGFLVIDSTNLTIQNCTVQQIGYWTNAYPMASTQNGQLSYGILAYADRNVVISNCNLTECWEGIHISSGFPASTLITSNVTVAGCDFEHYLVWCIVISAESVNDYLNTVTITNNSLHDYPEMGFDLWTGYPSSGDGGNPHLDGIITGVFDPLYTGITMTNMVVAGNKFYENNAYTQNKTAAIFMTDIGGQWNIYNNLCANVLASDADFYIQDAAFSGQFVTANTLSVNFLNNTFAGTANNGIFMRWTGSGNGSDPGLGKVTLTNNIFYMTNSVFSYYPLQIQGTINGFFGCDYNLYFNNTHFNDGDCFMWEPASTPVYYSLAQMQSDFGYETHGLNSLDPQFVNLSFGFGNNTIQNNFSPSVSSPAINAAANENSLFAVDLFNAFRPLTGPWTMGAILQISAGVMDGTGGRGAMDGTHGTGIMHP